MLKSISLTFEQEGYAAVIESGSSNAHALLEGGFHCLTPVFTWGWGGLHGWPSPTELSVSLFLPSEVRTPILMTEAVWWSGVEGQVDEDWVGNLLLVLNLFFFPPTSLLPNSSFKSTLLNCHLIIILKYDIQILKTKLKGLIKYMNI